MAVCQNRRIHKSWYRVHPYLKEERERKRKEKKRREEGREEKRSLSLLQNILRASHYPHLHHYKVLPMSNFMQTFQSKRQ